MAAYAAFAALGLRALSAKRSYMFELASVIGLFFASLCIQVIVPMGAPAGYDLTKWASVNYLPGSSGYFQIARQNASPDPWKFLADYPDWIRTQDVFHIGTHPPGLIVAQCLLLRAMDQNPGLRNALFDHMPPSVNAGFRVFGNPAAKPLTRAEQAALYATALITLLACAGTVIPLYWLARAALPAHTSWVAAVLWPLAPCANLFQPVADTAYPLLSTTALALAVWSVRSTYAPRDSPFRQAAARNRVGNGHGIRYVLHAGIPSHRSDRGTRRDRKHVHVAQDASARAPRHRCRLLRGPCRRMAALGANPFIIGSWNLKHHAEFYVEYPRGYWRWLWVNPVEMTIAIGIPTVVWCSLGYRDWRNVPLSSWSTLLVLTLVNLTGRNMGEVARLWMLFIPPLLLAAGVGFDRLRAPPSRSGCNRGFTRRRLSRSRA